MNLVYHGSKQSGLKYIKPHRSTHGQEWVYATRDLAISVLFLANYGGDFTCCIGRENPIGKPYVCERFPGAFSQRYSNKKGSVYILEGTGFLANKTPWDEELVSDKPVKVLEEILIEDAMDFLLNLHRLEQLTVMKHPQRPPMIPDNDEDLVERGIVWARQFGDRILEDIRKFHPNLLDRVEDGLKNGKYLYR